MSKMIQPVQTGVRIEKRLLKVLKALAEQLDLNAEDSHALDERGNND